MHSIALFRNVAVFFWVASGLASCTFSNSLGVGDYVQQPRLPRAADKLEKADFYVTCTSFARNYDQVVKVSPCPSLSLTSIVDNSVQQEVLGNFTQLGFPEPLGVINTQRPETSGVKKIVHLDVSQEYSWPRLGFQALISTLTLTLVPLNYPRDYTITLSIEDANGKVEKSASRNIRINNWWWMPLMFSYPFYNENRASENALLHTGRDLVRELETGNIGRR